MSDLDTPPFTREPPRMAVSPGDLNAVEKTRNMSAADCFHSRNTVLQGQPFGGIPTVLFLNCILWVVSPGHCGGQTVMQQRLRWSNWTPATAVGTP